LASGKREPKPIAGAFSCADRMAGMMIPQLQALPKK